MTRRIACTLVLAALAWLAAPAALRAETIKARVLVVDEKKHAVRVDVAGQPRTYNIDDRSLYHVLRPGRLVVLTAELVSGRHTIVEAKGAELRGRVTDFDERQASITLNDTESSATTTYYLDAEVSGRGIRRGDILDFESEERGRRSVITRWVRVGVAGGSASSRPSSTDRLSDSGRVYDVNEKRLQVTIDLSSGRRRQTFDVAQRRFLNDLRNGDRVEIQYELRGSNPPMITAVR